MIHLIHFFIKLLALDFIEDNSTKYISTNALKYDFANLEKKKRERKNEEDKKTLPFLYNYDFGSAFTDTTLANGNNC
jgi:hypothetical protein